MKQKIFLMLALLTTILQGARAQWNGGTYTATGDESINGTIHVGTATLTINEGVTVSVDYGIIITGTLTVTGSGTLIVFASDGGEGENGGNAIVGNVIINGANVQATGGDGGNGDPGYNGEDEYYDKDLQETIPAENGGDGNNGGNGGAAFTGQVTLISGSITATGGNGGNGGDGGWGGDGDLGGKDGTSGNGGDAGDGGNAFTGTLIFYGGTVIASGGEEGERGYSPGGDSYDGESGDCGYAFSDEVDFKTDDYSMKGGAYKNPGNDIEDEDAIYYQYVTIEAPNAVAASITLADNADNTAFITAADGYLANVTLTDRTLFKDGAWNTICLPFNVDLTADGCPLAGATARTLTSASISGTTLNLTFGDAVTDLEAGTPYIIKWASGANLTEADLVFNGVTIDKTDRSFTSADGKVSFKGTYAYQAFDSENKNILLVGGNKLYWPQSGASLGACRAYFQLADGVSASEFVLNFGEGDGDVTGVNEVREVIEVNDDSWYTLDGRKIANGQKPTAKGIYVNNGRKVVVK